ncbi:hypothetical protein Tco_0053475 [Tanacetum coccineum]
MEPCRLVTRCGSRLKGGGNNKNNKSETDKSLLDHGRLAYQCGSFQKVEDLMVEIRSWNLVGLHTTGAVVTDIHKKTKTKPKRTKPSTRLEEREKTKLRAFSFLMGQPVRILHKSQENGQTRTRERKSTQRAGRKLSKVKNGQLKSTFGQGKTSPSTLIGGDPRKNDTVDMKEAQGNKAFTLGLLTKEAQTEELSVPPGRVGEAIVLPEINAGHFAIKTNLLQLVQANPFNDRETENPHAHINSFKRITSTLRFRNVPNNVIKLMMFPYSLEGAVKTFYPTIKEFVSNDKEKLLELVRYHTRELLGNAFFDSLKQASESLENPEHIKQRLSSTNDQSVKRIDIIDAVCEEYAPEFLGFPNSSGGNPTPTSDPFTSEFILEEIKSYLKDDSIFTGN